MPAFCGKESSSENFVPSRNNRNKWQSGEVGWTALFFRNGALGQNLEFHRPRIQFPRQSASHVPTD